MSLANALSFSAHRIFDFFSTSKQVSHELEVFFTCKKPRVASAKRCLIALTPDNVHRVRLKLFRYLRFFLGPEIPT